MRNFVYLGLWILGFSSLQAALLPDFTLDDISNAPHSSKKAKPSPTTLDQPKSPLESNLPTPADKARNTAEEVTFEQAYALLLETSDAIKAQDLSVDRAKKLALGAKLSFLPEINASVFYTHLDRKIQEQLPMDTSSIPPALSQQFAPLLSALNQPIVLLDQNIIIGALTMIYPLYTGGARIQGSKIAAIAHKDAKEALRLKKLSSFEELANVYYGAVLAENLAQVLAQSSQATKQHYANALALEKSGQIARVEVLAAQVAHDKSLNALSQAQNAATIASLTLNSTLSSQNLAPIDTLKLVEKPLPPESIFIQKTLASYPVLTSLDLKVQSAKEAKTLALAPFLPQIVGFGAVYANNANHALIMRAIPTWHIGVAANLSLITPKARIQHYQAAKLTQLEMQSLANQARKDITLLVKNTYKQALYAQEEYKSRISSINLAKENLKLQENAFKQGLATSMQVIDAQNALQNALIEQQTSAYKAIIALARLFALSDDIEGFYPYRQ